jgi:hypothetical protein
LNRLSSDGDILTFYKDSTLVGSIGVVSGDRLYIGGGGNNGIGIDQHLFPTDDDGILLDATMNLGASNARYQDLYLSGGIALGGTGSANYLDDYEEGTFSVSVSTSGYTLVDSAGFYTKIGRQVTVTGFVKFDPVGSQNSAVVLGGLPFTSAALDDGHSYAGVARESVVSGDIFVAQVSRGTSTFLINSMDGVGSGQNQIFVANRNVVFNITYFV